MTQDEHDAKRDIEQAGLSDHKVWQRMIVRDRVGSITSDTGWRQRPGTIAAHVERFTRVYAYTLTRDSGSQTTLRKIMPERTGTQEVLLRRSMPPELRRK